MSEQWEVNKRGNWYAVEYRSPEVDCIGDRVYVCKDEGEYFTRYLPDDSDCIRRALPRTKISDGEVSEGDWVVHVRAESIYRVLGTFTLDGIRELEMLEAASWRKGYGILQPDNNRRCTAADVVKFAPDMPLSEVHPALRDEVAKLREAAKPKLVPFDYDSWRMLLKQHGGNVWTRNEKGTVSVYPCFSESLFAGMPWDVASRTILYSTDFGDTWHPMLREVTK